jgi:hypothetical protein
MRPDDRFAAIVKHARIPTQPIHDFAEHVQTAFRDSGCSIFTAHA